MARKGNKEKDNIKNASESPNRQQYNITLSESEESYENINVSDNTSEINTKQKRADET